MGKKCVDNFVLTRWRSADAVEVLRAVADYLKQDATFTPRESHTTTRWHVTARSMHFEIICTGAKYFDTRAKTGGAGAIDLVMHLLGTDFKQAVKILQTKEL